MDGTRRLAVWGELRLDGRDPGLRPRERAVLAVTAFEHPRPAPMERIVELVWGDAAPAPRR